MTAIATVMTTPPVTATVGEPLAAAVRRMHDHRVGSVLVMEGNRAVGIVTERDVLRATAGGDPGLTVAGVMTAPVDTIDVATSLQEALATMRERGYRHMPVTDHGNPVGVVSLRDLMRVASIGPAEVPRGLKGVVVADTAVGDVRGSEGFYHYRQYSAVELAEQRPIEDVWRLMIDGALPANAAERAAFIAEVAPLRAIPPAVAAVLPAIAAVSEPLDGSAHRAVAGRGRSAGCGRSSTSTRAQRRADALFLCAVTPALLCALHRLRRGLPIVDPRDDLGYAANYLWMLTGAEPTCRARAGRRAVPDLHDRPRLQRIDVHRPGRRVHRRRPRGVRRRPRSAR